ncbi:unnamed protein product [Rotaria sordida]|uniref:RING-type E3 ubiquitin transferase n=2 Tax=Rotaria sordida TaxID=392033 RepID=A0A818Z9H5_9BILA|nr:unnamed protein product [Rotaria sordida]CAF3765990.1 unnamed protein product [Rotaria sordida]
MMNIISLILSYFLLSIVQVVLSDVYVYNNSNITIEDFDDQGASFGPSFPTGGLKGYIITTNPENGCKKILPPPNIPTFGYYWIAVIPRTIGNDTCEFALKVQNAQNANFSAVIIYNFEDKIITMGSSGSSGKNVHIPSTLITRTNGLKLISHYLYNKTSVNSTPLYHIKIMPEETLPVTAYLIPIAVILAFTILGLIGFILVKIYLRRRQTRRHRLPRSALKQLKIKKFVKGDPWEVCAICLDDYEDGAKLRILPCDHAYHMKCIDPWLINNRRQCPVCKRYVFPDHDNSDEEGNNNQQQQARTPTEQTPLVHSNNNINSTTDISINQRLSGRRLLNPSGRGIHNVSFASNESLEDVESLSSSLQTTSVHPATTVGVTFDRPLSNSRRYGSIHESSTTPRVANFFVGSIGGATDNTNVSVPSVAEDVSDIEIINDDGDEAIHSITTRSEENPAYVDDEGSTTNTSQIYL